MFSLTELGRRLREAREEKGLTLEDLQNITKIQKRYLAGIEEGKYDMIPGKFYVRAFIKQYAEAVGLQPEVLFDEYRKEIPSVYEEDLPEQLSRTQSRREIQTSPKIFEIFPKILVAVFIIGAAILLWYFGQKLLEKGDGGQPTDQTVNDSVDIGESGTPPAVEDGEGKDEDSHEKGEDADSNEEAETEEPTAEEDNPQELTVIETKGEDTVYELRNAERFELQIRTVENGESWIKITDGNQRTLQEGITLNKKTPEITHDFTDKDTVRIRIGAAHKTEIFVNGEKLVYANEPTSKENITQNIIIRYVKEGE